MFSYAVVAANTKPAKTTDRAMFLVIARILMLITASNTQETVAPRLAEIHGHPGLGDVALTSTEQMPQKSN